MSISSVQNSNPVEPVGPIAKVPLASSVIVFNSSSADTSYGDPFVWMAANPNEAKEVSEGGRIFIAGGSALQQIEVMPFFTTAEATASFQLIAFDREQLNLDNSYGNSSRIHPQSGHKNFFMGTAYNLALDQTEDVSSLTTTFSTKAVASGSDVSYRVLGNKLMPDESGGTAIYPGLRHIVERGGSWAILPIVTAISAGTLILVMKTI